MSSIVLASTEVTAAIVAVAATAATLLLALVGWSISRRARHDDEDRIASLVRDLDSRMEEMGRELSQALERARDETRRGRLAGDLAGTLDLEDVMRKTLEAATGVPGTDAALISVESVEGEPLSTAIGLSDSELEYYAVGPAPSGSRVRSMIVEYDGGFDPRPGAEPPVTVGLAVPINTALERLGLLTIYTRGDPTVFSESQLRELEDIAARAAPPLQNARRFREARQLADLDGLTSLHNRRYFHETLAREVSRAHRYGRRLALLVLDLDNLKAINDQYGHLSGDAALNEVAQRIRSVVRSADVPCRVGGDEFAVILPESGLEDADQLYRRLQAEISVNPVVDGARVLVSGGVAELRAQEDPTVLYQRADEALYRAKEAGRGRLSA
jgi:diguanylate cyclase (GGDEF)-like protein